MDYPKTQPKLTTRDLILRLHSWFLSHRFQLKKWWVILILSVDILLIVYISTSFLVLATQSSRLNRGLINTALSLSPPAVLVTETPSELSVNSAVALVQSANQTDFIARVDNANSNWAAEFAYHFELNSGQLNSDWSGTKSGTGLILPEQSVFLSSVGEPVSVSSAAQAKLVIDQRTWRRVSDRSRLDNIRFNVTDIVYEPNVSVPNSSTRVSRVTAQITNRSLYGFWTVDVPVVLLIGDKPAAIKHLTLRSFRPSETRTVEAQWFGNLPTQASVDIRPAVDIFDEQNYMN